MARSTKPAAAKRTGSSGAASRWRGNGSAGRVMLIAVILSVGLVGALVGWLTVGSQNGGRESTDIPLLRADAGPMKVRPASPGGMEIPDQDKLIYERLSTASGPPRVERLLPPAEAPAEPPTPEQAMPEKPMTEGATSAPEPEAQAKSAPDQPQENAEQTTAAPATVAKVAPAPPPPPAEPTEKSVAKPAAKSPAPPTKTASKTPTKTASKTPSKPLPKASSGFGIQLAAVRSEKNANAEWKRLSGRYGEVLGGLKPIVSRADLGDRGVFYRLRAGPMASEADARSLCASLSKQRVACLVVRLGG